MKLPKIPKELHRGTKKKMTIEMEIKGKQLLQEGNSQRFVAKELGVSRHTLLIHCKEGYRELFTQRYKNWDYIKTQPNQIKARRESAKRRWKILTEIAPDKLKAYRRKQKEKIGKEYFKLKAREFRKNHPNYHYRYKFLPSSI